MKYILSVTIITGWLVASGVDHVESQKNVQTHKITWWEPIYGCGKVDGKEKICPPGYIWKQIGVRKREETICYTRSNGHVECWK